MAAEVHSIRNAMIKRLSVAQFFVYWGDSKRVYTGKPSPISGADCSNVRVLPARKPMLEEPLLDDENVDQAEQVEQVEQVRIAK